MIIQYSSPSTPDKRGNLHIGSGRLSVCFSAHRLNDAEPDPNVTRVGQNVLMHDGRWHRGTFGIDQHLPLLRMHWNHAPETEQTGYSQRLNTKAGLLETRSGQNRPRVASNYHQGHTDTMGFAFDGRKISSVLVSPFYTWTTCYYEWIKAQAQAVWQVNASCWRTSILLSTAASFFLSIKSPETSIKDTDIPMGDFFESTKRAWEFSIGTVTCILPGCKTQNPFHYEIHNAAYTARMALVAAQVTGDHDRTHAPSLPVILWSAKFYTSALRRRHNELWGLHIALSMGQNEFLPQNTSAHFFRRITSSCRTANLSPAAHSPHGRHTMKNHFYGRIGPSVPCWSRNLECKHPVAIGVSRSTARNTLSSCRLMPSSRYKSTLRPDRRIRTATRLLPQRPETDWPLTEFSRKSRAHKSPTMKTSRFMNLPEFGNHTKRPAYSYTFRLCLADF